MDDLQNYNTRLAEAYAEYLTVRNEEKLFERAIQYDWFEFPKNAPLGFMPYCEMLRSYPDEIANEINDLSRSIESLSSWDKVIRQRTIEDAYDLHVEFTQVIGKAALCQPYAIKNKFAVACGNLCHALNIATSKPASKLDIPLDYSLTLNDIDGPGKEWRNFRKFKISLEKIANNEYRDETGDFRNAYTHRFSRHIGLGLSVSVKREKKSDGSIQFAIGSMDPITLTELVDALTKQRHACSKAFSYFQNLIFEQIEHLPKDFTGPSVSYNFKTK